MSHYVPLTFGPHRRRAPREVRVEQRTGPVTAAAVVDAAALIAMADGRAEPEERLALIRFLRRHGLLARYGREKLLRAYDRAVARPSRWSQALERLRPVAGMRGRHLVTAAALQVAMADGVAWPQEIALLNMLRRCLTLDCQRPRDAASWEPGF